MDKPEKKVDAKDPPAKLPYEPPSIEVEDLFEVLALSCGKTPQSLRIPCQAQPRVS